MDKTERKGFLAFNVYQEKINIMAMKEIGAITVIDSC